MNTTILRTRFSEFSYPLLRGKTLFLLCLLSSFISTNAQLKIGGSSDLFPVKKDGRWGYINEKGEIKLEVKYDLAFQFSSGYAMIKENGELAIINKEGEKMMIPEKGYSVKEFATEDKLPYRCKHGDGFYDLEEKIYEAPKYAFVSSYSNGLASFKDKQSGMHGFLTKKGKIKIQAQFEAVGKFNDGLCPVRLDGKWAYINKSGKLKCINKYTFARDFSEGLAGTWKYSKYVVYINEKQEEIFKHQIFANPNNLSNSFSLPFFDFSEGMLKVIDYKSGLFGYKNKDGEIEVRYQYKEANDFKDGLACVKYGNKYGFINKKGDMSIPANYDYAEDFKNGLAAVYKGGSAKEFKEGKEGVSMAYINKKGKIIWEYSN